jgi:hypothetical protein
MPDPYSISIFFSRRRARSLSRSSSILLLLLFVLLPELLPAQQRLDPVAVGQGKASVANARGLSALYSNIGSLALDPLGQRSGSRGERRVEVDFSILPVGAAAGATFLSPSDFNFVFASKNLDVFTDQDRQRLAKLVAPERLSADLALGLVALRLRVPGIAALGFEYGHQVRARMNFPENFRTNVIGSGDVFSKNQLFSDPEIGGEWVRTMRFTLATALDRPLVDPMHSVWFPSIGFGLQATRLTGLAHFDVGLKSHAQTQIVSRPGESPRMIRVTGNYSFRSSVPDDTTFAPADALLKPGFSSGSSSSGEWGGAFGMSMVVLRKVVVDRDMIYGDPLNPQQVFHVDTLRRDAILFGFVVDDVGSLVWNGKNQMRSRPIDTVIVEEKGVGVTNALLDRFQGKLDTLGPFMTSLPAHARLGVGVDVTAFLPTIPGDLFAEMEGNFDLNDAIGHEGTRFSVGASWSPAGWVTLRSGLQLGGRVGSALSFGTGFYPWPWLSIEAATSDVASIFNGNRQTVDVAFQMAGHVRF